MDLRRGVVNTLHFDRAKCTGCGRCVDVCPHGVFEMDGGGGGKSGKGKNKRARIVAKQACMECGACKMNCSAGAISVDSGVGCAWAMIKAALLRSNKGEVCCGPSSTQESSECETGECKEP